MRLLVGLRLAVLAAGLACATTAGAAPPSLSAEQRQRLDAGEVVVLDALPPGASESAQGGTAVGVVCAPAAAVWNVLVDWRNHPGIYPRVTRAEVTHADPQRVRVLYALSIWPFSLDLHMDKHPDAARRRVTWRIAEDKPSTFFAENSGYWQVDDEGVRGAVVTYAVATRTLLPGFVTRGAQRDSLVSTIEALRTRVEGAGSGPRAPCGKRPGP